MTTDTGGPGVYFDFSQPQGGSMLDNPFAEPSSDGQQGVYFDFSGGQSDAPKQADAVDRGPVDLAANMMIGFAKGGASLGTALGGLIEMASPGVGAAIRKGGQNTEDWLASKLDPAYKDALDKKWATLKSGEAAWADWRSWTMGLSELAPIIAAQFIGAGELADAGYGAQAIAGAEAAFGGALTGGASAADVAQRIERNPEAVPRVRTLMSQGFSQPDAVRMATTEAQRIAGTLGVLVGTVGGAALHGVVGKTVGEAAADSGILARMGKAGLAGGATMGAMSGGQEAATQAGAAYEGVPFDPARIGEAAASGLGPGGLGAAFGAYSASDRTPTPAARAAVEASRARDAADAEAATTQAARAFAKEAVQSSYDAPGRALPPPEATAEYGNVIERIGDLQNRLSDADLAPGDRAVAVSELRKYSARAQELRDRGAADPDPATAPDPTEYGTNAEAARTGQATEDVAPPTVAPGGVDALTAGVVRPPRIRTPIREVVGRIGPVDVSYATSARMPGPETIQAATVADRLRAGPLASRTGDLDLYGAATQVMHAEQAAMLQRTAVLEQQRLNQEDPTRAVPRRVLDERPPAGEPLMLTSSPNLQRLVGQQQFLTGQLSRRRNLPPTERASLVSRLRDVNRQIGVIRGTREQTAALAGVPPADPPPQRELFPEVRVGGMGERPGTGSPTPPVPDLPSVPGTVDMTVTRGVNGEARTRLPQGAAGAAEAAAVNPGEFTDTPLGRVISTSQERSRRSQRGWETRRAKAAGAINEEITKGVETPAEESRTVATQQVRDVLTRLRAGEVVGMNDVIDYVRPALPETMATVFDRIRAMNLDTEVVADTLSDRQGEYDPATDTITVDPAVPDPALVLTHEMVHAATLVGYRTNKRVAKFVDQLAKDLQAQAAGRATPQDWARYSRYLANGEEFIAGMLSDPAFADWADVQRAGGMSPYWRFKQGIGSFLGLKGDANETLSAVVDYANRLMLDADTQDSLRAALQASGRGAPAALSWFDDVAAHLFPADPEKVQSMRDVGEEKVFGLWKGSLYLTSLQQIVERNMDLFANGDMPNLLQRHFDLTNQREAMANRLRQGYEHIATRWRDFRALNVGPAGDLARLMIDTTLSAIHPDRPSTHETNAWGVGRPGGTQKHADFSARWAALPDEAKRIYGDVRDAFERDWENSLRSILTARGEASDIDEATMAGVRTYDDIDRLDTDVQTKADLKAAMDLGKVHGPYFPLRRTGKYFTIATSDWKTRIVSDAELSDLGSTPETQISSYSRVSGGWKVRYRNRVVESHNTMGEAKRSAADYKRQGGRFDWKEDPYVLARAEAAGRIGDIEGATANSLVSKLEGVSPAAAELARRFFYERVPDTSVLKQRLKRRGIAGADADMLPSFGVYARANSYHQAQVTYGRHLQETVNGMRGFAKQLAQMGLPERSAKATAVYNHLVERDRTLRDLGRRSGEVTGLGKAWAAAPQLAAFWALTGFGSVITNATQPIIFTFPTLAARHGYARSLKTMGEVYAQTGPAAVGEMMSEYGRMARGASQLKRVSPSSPEYSFFEHVTQRLPEDERAMVQRMADLNRIDFGLAADVQATAKESGGNLPVGRMLGLGPENEQRVKDVFGFISDFSFIAPQAVETMNRVVTAVSAYRLAKEDGVREPAELERYVARSLDKTQWLYSQSNKPLAFMMGGPLLRPMLTFKSYPQHVYFTMMTYAMDAARIGREQGWMKGAASEPGRVALGITAMTALFSGVSGAAFEPLWWLWKAACWWQGIDPDLTLKKAADGVFGEKLGDVARRGIPAGLGMDMSRVGISNLLLSDNGLPDTKDKLFADVGQIALGAPGGMFVGNSLDAINKWRNGDARGAASLWLPHAAGLQDMVRAWDLSQRGQVDTQGNVITPPSDVTPFDVAVRAMGFQPSGGRLTHEGRATLGLATEERKIEYAAKQEANDPRKRLLTRYARASQDGDDTSGIVQEMMAYNKRFPAMAITRQTLHRSMSALAKRQVQTQALGFAGSKQDMLIMRDIMDAYDGSS